VAVFTTWAGQWDFHQNRLVFSISVCASLATFMVAFAVTTGHRRMLFVGASALLMASLVLVIVVFFI
jgi:hypothetical protein